MHPVIIFHDDKGPHGFNRATASAIVLAIFKICYDRIQQKDQKKEKLRLQHEKEEAKRQKHEEFARAKQSKLIVKNAASVVAAWSPLKNQIGAIMRHPAFADLNMQAAGEARRIDAFAKSLEADIIASRSESSTHVYTHDLCDVKKVRGEISENKRTCNSLEQLLEMAGRFR